MIAAVLSLLLGAFAASIGYDLLEEAREARADRRRRTDDILRHVPAGDGAPR